MTEEEYKAEFERKKAEALAKKEEWLALTPKERLELITSGLIKEKQISQSNINRKWKIPYQYPIEFNGIFYGFYFIL
jgi:hypothetical protein